MTADLYLRFPTHTDALRVFLDLGMTYTDDEGVGHLSQGGHQWALWAVGEIPGVDGYHVNLRVLDPELDLSALESYRVYPSTPSVVWA